MDIEEVKRLVELKINEDPESYEGVEKIKLAITNLETVWGVKVIIIIDKYYSPLYYVDDEDYYSEDFISEYITNIIKAYIRELNAGMYQ